MEYNNLYEFYDSINKLILRYVKNTTVIPSLNQITRLINTIPIPKNVLEELIYLILEVTNWSEKDLLNQSKGKYNAKTIKDLIKDIKINNSTYDILVYPFLSIVTISTPNLKYLKIFNNNKKLNKFIILLTDLIRHQHIKIRD